MNPSLPAYECHKKVHAAKIVAIDFGERLDLAPFGVVEVGEQWIREKHAEVGGYYVIYEDGYTSFSPAKAFEDGYTTANGQPVGTMLLGPEDPKPEPSGHPYPRFGDRSRGPE